MREIFSTLRPTCLTVIRANRTCTYPLAIASSCGRRPGKKSILSAAASFAAVRNEKLTSWRRTFEMYGRDTFILFARSVCDIPSAFMRQSIWRRKTDPIWSIVFTSRSPRKEDREDYFQKLPPRGVCSRILHPPALRRNLTGSVHSEPNL